MVTLAFALFIVDFFWLPIMGKLITVTSPLECEPLKSLCKPFHRRYTKLNRNPWLSENKENSWA